MSLVRTQPVSERGSDSVVSQSIGGSSNYTKVITLKRDDYTHGTVLIGNPASIAEANQRRITAIVFVTTTLSQAASQATQKLSQSFVSYQGPLYTVPNWQHKAWFYDKDSRLSDSIFQEEALDFTRALGIRLLSAQIDGSELKLIFRNTRLIVSRTLTVDIEWRVEKVKHAS